jgi:hypothetical protein
MEKNGLLAVECIGKTIRDGFVYRDIDDVGDGVSLPYEKLGGEGFERLCFLYLLSQNKNPHFFARQGQPDFGVDLTSRMADGSFTLYQCKNRKETRKKFSRSEFLDIFEEFNNRWVREQGLPKPGSFVLCTSAVVGKDKENHKAFIGAADCFAQCFKEEWGQDIQVKFLDRTDLDEKLKLLPHVVADALVAGGIDRPRRGTHQ